MEKSVVLDMLKKYTSVVIWGLKEPTNTSTQRHIHRHLFMVLSKIGANMHWCSNTSEDNDLIPTGSLVITSEQCRAHLLHKKENWYASFHAPDGIADCKNFLNMRVYGDSEPQCESVQWGPTIIFSKQDHILWQSFGTNLLPDEFLPPVFNPTGPVNWVGSIWNDAKNQGNIKNMYALREALQRRGIDFIHCQDISDEENIVKVRQSRIAPAIGGEFQTKAMLPCRIWKNISYGHLGVTNLSRSLDVFGFDVIYNPNIEELIGQALSIKETDYKEITARQQEAVAKGHTYLDWLYNTCRALEELGIQ